MYAVTTFNRVTMTGKAIAPNGQEVDISGTYAFNFFDLYDHTNRKWLYGAFVDPMGVL